MIGSAASKFDKEGNLTDDATKQQIQKLLLALVASTRQPAPVAAHAATK
jgi:hypothetical protein